MFRKATTNIVVDFVYPPIPRRDFDWCAYYEGEEELGNQGWGRTERLARYDLLSKTSWWGEYLYAIEDLREGCLDVGMKHSRFRLGVEIICFSVWESLCRLFRPNPTSNGF